MGTWGLGPFDNDDAADWVYQLTPDADEAVVIAAFAAVESEDESNASVAQAAIAAAEVVAAALGRPAPDLPVDVRDWVEARMARPWAPVAQLAIRALDRVATDSELRELWDESDDAGEWTAGIRDLQGRLGASRP